MDRLLRRQLLWLGAGLVFYLTGGVLLLVVVFEGMASPGVFRVRAITSGPWLALLLASTALFGVGGYCMQRGRSIGPGDRSPLGGRRGPRSPGRGGRTALPEDITVRDPDGPRGSPDAAPGDGAVCPNCRARNEPGFTFCWNCSERL